MELMHAANSIKNGGIVAYPTEAVYGLGCDPFNKVAVERLLTIKQRSVDKGFIVLVSSWQQVNQLITDVTHAALEPVRATWPGPITWVFPAQPDVPTWLTGRYPTIALRMTDHPVAKALLQALNQPLISTSTNRAGQAPLRDDTTVQAVFGSQIDGIVSGEVGKQTQPTTMKDVITGAVLRA